MAEETVIDDPVWIKSDMILLPITLTSFFARASKASTVFR
jgi:hypothetical protein